MTETTYTISVLIIVDLLLFIFNLNIYCFTLSIVMQNVAYKCNKYIMYLRFRSCHCSGCNKNTQNFDMMLSSLNMNSCWIETC